LVYSDCAPWSDSHAEEQLAIAKDDVVQVGFRRKHIYEIGVREPHEEGKREDGGG
jgi:hypothetical protein